MSWMQSILFALICGIAEFLPISAPAHATLLQHLFGVDAVDPLFRFFLHGGMLAAVLVSSRDQLHRFRAERRLNQRSARKRQNFTDSQVKIESGLVRTAALVLLVSFLFYKPAQEWSSSLNVGALFLLLCGILLFVLAHLPRRHRDTRAMTPLDGFLIGISGWLAVFSGISRVGMTTSMASLRGANMSNAYKWSVLISIPALAALLVLDLINMFTVGVAFGFGLVFQSIMGAFFAFVGAYISIYAMRAFLQKGELSGFAYYCWGAALFSIILYLI